MSEQHRFRFDELGHADLVVDAVYEGGPHGDLRDDPIAPLLGGGNQGGFRYLGSSTDYALRHCTLYTDLTDLEWPDRLDVETGLFTYYGDNKRPGSELHSTQRGGNRILRETFHRLHRRERHQIPPIFVFTRSARGRDVVFRGLAVPGAAGIDQTEDLVAIWKTTRDQRFQNYRAIFTILDVPVVPRSWIDAVRNGAKPDAGAPPVWLRWRAGGIYEPLQAPPTRQHRTAKEQLPAGRTALSLVKRIVDHYARHQDGAYGFERCAAAIVRLMDPNVVGVDMTRFWRDGGRDALGHYQIGTTPASVTVEFALEAKCKRLGNSSGVRETARLLARIRHRQFGIFVTTSCISTQAYEELIEDDQPIIVIAGADIARILIDHGLSSTPALDTWLRSIDGELTT